jgi:hypothetical protein
MLVSFNCDHCTAVLSIPEEQSGISGPCPFCGSIVSSPRRMSQAAVADLSFANDPVTADEPRIWRQPQLMTPEQTVLPRRSGRLGLKVAACAALFVGGVAGTWKLWHGDSQQTPPQNPVGELLPKVPSRPVPASLSVSEEPDESLPPPSDQIPSALPPVPTAVARNVSTAPSPVVSLSSPPEPAPLFPETTKGVNAHPSAEAPSNPPGSAGLSAAEREIRRVVPHGGALAAPGNVLVRFFAAKTWTERHKYVLAPGRVKPLMEAYYKIHADGPIIPEDIELMRMDAVEEDPTRHYFAFLVYFPDRPDGVPISVEETKTGPLVEWTSFAEGKDMLLEKFYSKYRKEPGTFRALVRRGHYFESDVPDQKEKMVFDINPPDRTGPYKMWLDKDSAAVGRHFRDNQFGWNTVAMMVVTLKWERTSSGAEYVRLLEVAADSWHPEVLPRK